MPKPPIEKNHAFSYTAPWDKMATGTAFWNTKYGASSHFVDAYLDYANASADGMKALANNITSLINVYTAEKSDK